MSNISLDASIRTCRFDTGEAARVQSDRFQNPNNMVCIPWDGYNSKGQRVCSDSYYTKRRGCNSALDRIHVENHLRPQYADYINLNIQGVEGDIYGNQTAWRESGQANLYQDSRNKITGNFGNQFLSSNYQGCGINSYERGMAEVSKANREAAFASSAFKSNSSRTFGWF